MYESICAFSNTKGGYILLGINPSTLKPEGVTFDIQQKKDEITNKCLEIYNQRVFVHIIHDSVDSKDIVVINVEESKDKTVYIKKDGQPKGAFRRVNGINKKCCWDDIKDFELHKRIAEFDRESIDQAMINDIDDESIFFYKKERESVDQNVSELKYTDKISFLRALGCMDSSNKINVCGLLCFGTDQAINYYFPSSHADIIISESDDWAPNINNWSSLYRTHKSLLKQWNDLIVEMKDRLPSTTRIDKNFQRKTMPILPDIVIRECITNMIIHRDYRVLRPSQIIKYRKSIDVSN